MEKVELKHDVGRHSAYAYITFFNDKDACFALLNELRDRSPMIVEISPAYTWKQPPFVQSSAEVALVDSGKSFLLKLNDHCLLKIIEYCDLHTQANFWKVCSRMRRVIEVFELGKLDQYMVEFKNGKPIKRLKQVRDELQYIGPYVQTLCLFETKNSTEIISPVYLHQCKKYLGSSLKELRLDGISPDIFLDSSFETLLLRVESLYVQFRFWFTKEWSIPKHIHAPELKSLTVSVSNSKIDDEMDVFFFKNKFPQLEKTVLSMWPTTSGVETFLKENVQLKHLEILCTLEQRELLTVIADVATNLEALVWSQFCLGHNDASIFKPLEKCQKLEKIGFSCCVDNEDVDLAGEICKSLVKVKTLRSIVVWTDNGGNVNGSSRLFADVGRELPHLEYFDTTVKMNQSTIIEFVKFARHLKVFCMELDQFVCPMSISFIKTLVEARKTFFEKPSDAIVILDLIFYPLELETKPQHVCSLLI